MPALNCAATRRRIGVDARTFPSQQAEAFGNMKKLIAIVEDEPAIRDNYTAAFQRHGYAVRAYGTRKEAMEVMC